MNKLMNIHAAFTPLRNRSIVAAGGSFPATFARNAPAQAGAPRALQCSWTSDAAGHLVCSWSEPASPQDQSITRRGSGRVGAAISMAA